MPGRRPTDALSTRDLPERTANMRPSETGQAGPADLLAQPELSFGSCDMTGTSQAPCAN